jgi:hypothetical protein
MRRLMLLIVVLALGACGGPREKPTPRAEALRDTTPRELRVVKVWDQIEDSMDVDRDENVSHVIEVEVLSGPDQGKILALPYDEWNVGRRPPRAGERVVIAPADWVKRDVTGHGRPAKGYDKSP